MKSMLLATLEKAINMALSLDANTQQNLALLKNHTIKIELTDVQFVFYLSATDKTMFLQEHCLGNPHLTITGTLTAFIKMAASEDNHLPKEMEVMGNAHLAQTLQQFMHNIDIDWEEHLSRLTGDAIANQIGQFVQKGKTLLKRQASEFGLNVKEYFQEESDVLAREKDIEQFCQDVDTLRNDLARATAKFKQLEKESV